MAKDQTEGAMQKKGLRNRQVGLLESLTEYAYYVKVRFHKAKKQRKATREL